MEREFPKRQFSTLLPAFSPLQNRFQSLQRKGERRPCLYLAKQICRRRQEADPKGGRRNRRSGFPLSLLLFNLPFQVKLAVYNMYIRAASYWRSILSVSFLIAFMVFQMCRSFWLSSWSNLYDSNKTVSEINNPLHIGIYAAIGTVESTCFLLCLVIMVYGSLNASRNLHAPLIHNLMRSPMSFFDTTPLGRILNRCAKDVEVVDMLLPVNFRYLIMCLLQVSILIFLNQLDF